MGAWFDTRIWARIREPAARLAGETSTTDGSLSFNLLSLSTSVTPRSSSLRPVRVLETEISLPLPAISRVDPGSGRSHERAQVLVRLHGTPLGQLSLEIPEEGVSAKRLADLIQQDLEAGLQEHLRHDGWTGQPLDAHGITGPSQPRCLLDYARVLAEAPLISVILATRDRPDSLPACLDSLLRMDYPAFEIILVDNAPNTDATLRLLRERYARDDRIRYVLEERLGVSLAKNTGMTHARGTIAAFTDDDVVVDRQWLGRIAAGFAAGDHIACVTGLVLPLELDTAPQILFEEFRSFGRGFVRKRFDLGPNRPQSRVFPYSAGIYGAGNNRAFRLETLLKLGGFDPALGPGTPVGGEDLDAFFRLVYAGYTLAYEPAAIVRHRHRRDYASLRRQLGRGGQSGYLTKHVIENPRDVSTMAAKISYGLFYALSTHSEGNWRKKPGFPDDLVRAELLGMLAGPFLYLRSRRQARKLARPSAQAEASTVRHPVRLLQIEISSPLPCISRVEPENGRVYEHARAIVRLHGTPLGQIDFEIPAGGMEPTALARLIQNDLDHQVRDHLRRDGYKEQILTREGIVLPAQPQCLADYSKTLAGAPFISVVIATRDRTDSLRLCLDSLLRMDYPSYEIIVVDNAPPTDATERLISERYGSDERVRYLRDDRPSGGWAKNTGASAARGSIVAFTDDDVVVDRQWLGRMAAGFAADEQITCVTGLVLPLELETLPQIWFEDFRSFGRGFVPKRFDLSANGSASPIFPYSAGIFGAGNNAAFRREILIELGGFDPAMGAGAMVGGEDLDMFFRLILAGYVLAYEPSAVVHHCHRRDYASLRRQLARGGLTGYLTKHIVENPGNFLALAPKLVYGLWCAMSRQSERSWRTRRGFPPDLTRTERVTTLIGPLLYLRSRLWTKKIERESSTKKSLPEERPTRMLETEISSPLPFISRVEPMSGRSYKRAKVLVRLHGTPLGQLDLEIPEKGVSPKDLADLIQKNLHTELREHLEWDGWHGEHLGEQGVTGPGEPRCLAEYARVLADAPFISVVVATRDRPDSLATCLDSVLHMDYPAFEIILVDNAPKTDAAARLLDEKYSRESRIRYVREDRPGLSRARNAGVAEARGQIVAFTDDDVTVDREWLGRLAAGFAAGDHIACVTGLVLPAELETAPQVWYEEFRGGGPGFVPKRFDLGQNRPDSPVFPYAAGKYGSGNNMALRTEALKSLDGFDERLGAGAVVGGEDLDMFFRLILAGKTIAYEPAAIVRHLHRRDYASLRRQLSDGGVAGYLTKHILEDPRRLPALLVKLPAGVAYHRRNGSARRANFYPQDLLRAERRGMVMGALAYLRAELLGKTSKATSRRNSASE